MTEQQLHLQVCTYIRLQYPKVLFNSDMSGVKLPMGLAVKVKKLRSSRAYPDLMILEPNIKFFALFIELKKETPFKENGQLKSNEHLQEQKKMIDKLNLRGYYACFGWDFEMIKKIIDNYLNDKL